MSKSAIAALIGTGLLVGGGAIITASEPESVPEQVREVKELVKPIGVKTTSPAPKPTPKEPECHPSYSGCLNPNVSDYDCAGGSGNGPYYTGRVQVYGYDEYDLDRDRDGWGCE